MYQSKKIPFDSPDFGFQLPLSTPFTVQADGTVQVRVNLKTGSNATGFKAAIFDSDNLPDLSMVSDEDKTVLNQESTTLFYSAFVPVGAVALGTPALKNKTAVVWPTNGVEGSMDFTVNAAASYPYVIVTAKQSLWFAYAPPGYSQRPHLEVGDAYRPAPLTVPTDATKVSLTNVSTCNWGHGDPTNASFVSNADGTTWVSDLNATYAGEYQSDDLKSKKILGSALAHNKLVGMWGGDATQAGASNDPPKLNFEFAVGLGINLPVATDPKRATMLYLGMHDSYEWTNNWGLVTLTVTWSTT